MDQMELEACQRATERAERAIEAWDESEPGPYVTRTPQGEVTLEHVECRTEGPLSFLDVWAGGETEAGDPHFRIVNPPTLVEDPSGDIEAGGRRFREDPLAALAEVIARNGGAQRGRGRSQ